MGCSKGVPIFVLDQPNSTFKLTDNGVTGFAVFGDDLTIRAYVLTVEAARAQQKIGMADTGNALLDLQIFESPLS